MADRGVYAEILKEYEFQRDRAINKANAIKERVYEKYPRLSEIDKELSSTGINLVRTLGAATNKEAALSEFKAHYSNLENEKKSILINAGFPNGTLEPEYRCKICKDTGFVEGKECNCLKKRRIEKLYTMSNIDEKMKRENFDNFNWNVFSSEKDNNGVSQRSRMEEIYNTCIGGVDKIPEAPFYSLFLGRSGLGKTFLCSCLAKLLIDNDKSVVYMTAYDVADVLIKIKFNRATATDYDTMELIDTCDMLIIDDLGTEGVNSATNSELYTVINKRLLNRKSMIISTNLNYGDINRVYSERLASRFLGEFTTCQFIGNDLRLF